MTDSCITAAVGVHPAQRQHQAGSNDGYGQLLFESTGYSKPWDGTFKGSPVPAGTYYYIINPKNGRKQMSGFVDVIR